MSESINPTKAKMLENVKAVAIYYGESTDTVYLCVDNKVYECYDISKRSASLLIAKFDSSQISKLKSISEKAVQAWYKRISKQPKPKAKVKPAKAKTKPKPEPKPKTKVQAKPKAGRPKTSKATPKQQNKANQKAFLNAQQAAGMTKIQPFISQQAKDDLTAIKEAQGLSNLGDVIEYLIGYYQDN